MGLLDGFTLVELKAKAEESILTITGKNLKFNRGTARNLGLPPKVRFFVNDKVLQIALEPARMDDEDGVDFAFEEGKRERPICVKEPAVMDAVKKLAALEKDGHALQLTVNGDVYLEEQVIIFDLTEAKETIVKPRGKRKPET